MRLRVLALLVVVLVSLSAIAAPPIVVPSGTSIHFKINQSINTATAKAGQRVPGELTQPLVAGGKTIANAGAPVSVKVTFAEASGRIGGNSHLTLRLASITLANGTKAEVSSSAYMREGKSHVKHNATYIAGAAVLGALVGQASGGNRNSTAKGAAIGAGVGIGAAAATGKFDFTEAAGTHFDLKLKSPLSVSM